MLIYHPAFDAYHCVFRMLALINSLADDVEIDMLRLCDFYLVFPSEIEKIRLPEELSHGRKVAKFLSNTYRNPINSKQTFQDMYEIQLASLRNIAASGLIDIDHYERGIIHKNSSQKIPENIINQVEGYLESNPELTDFILKSFSKFPLRGVNGLKHRTTLLEYKYDTP